MRGLEDTACGPILGLTVFHVEVVCSRDVLPWGHQDLLGHGGVLGVVSDLFLSPGLVARWTGQLMNTVFQQDGKADSPRDQAAEVLDDPASCHGGIERPAVGVFHRTEILSGLERHGVGCAHREERKQ